MDNREYARILSEIATLQRIAGDNHFKVRAFERAARLVEDLPEPIDRLLDGHRAELLQGIGESIETELQALRTSGASPRHEELIARIGPGVLDLMDIQGLGMKRMQILFQEAGISSIAQLKRAAVEGRLRGLTSFGSSVEEKLLAEIEHWERNRGRRYPLPEAKGLADSIRHQLLELGEVARAEVGGSIRRGREMIGDIDILVTTQSARTVSSYFKSLPEVTEIIADGDTRASVRMIGGIQVDLRVLETHLFGAGLHYFTGSKEHHIQMRLRSKRLALKISEHGVCRHDDPDEVPVGPMDSEEELFAAVGLDYIPPEIREDAGEIVVAGVDQYLAWSVGDDNPVGVVSAVAQFRAPESPIDHRHAREIGGQRVPQADGGAQRPAGGVGASHSRLITAASCREQSREQEGHRRQEPRGQRAGDERGHVLARLEIAHDLADGPGQHQHQHRQRHGAKAVHAGVDGLAHRERFDDDSEQHRGHGGYNPSGESHFSLRIESPAFAGKSRVERQRMVFAALGELMDERVHALSIRATEPGES